MTEVRSTTDVNLYPYGDRELWFAHGENWALPLFVVFHEDKVNARHFALLEPCFGLYTSQHLALTKLFEAHDILGRDNRWLILKQTCEALLTKAPGITPERYYKWPDCKMRPLPAWKPVSYSPQVPKGVGKVTTTEDQREFVNYVAQSRNIPSSVVRIVFDAIADVAPQWMCEKRRAVDLGFCRIFTAPFRANWKEIVTFKLGGRNLLSMFSKNRNGELMAELEKAGLPEVMTSPHNIGLKERRPDFVMEIVPAPRFERYLKEFCDKSATKVTHVQQYEQMVESLYDELVAALRYYIKKVSTPFARIYYGGSAGIISLLPAIRSNYNQSTRVPLAALPQRIIPTASNFSVFAEQDRLAFIHSKTLALPEVSPVPPDPDDMWRSELAANVECFPGRDDAAGAPWLPLPNEGQGADTREQLLPCIEIGPGNAPGLD